MFVSGVPRACYTFKCVHARREIILCMFIWCFIAVLEINEKRWLVEAKVDMESFPCCAGCCDETRMPSCK